MRKLLFVLVPLLSLCVLGGALWWRYGRVRDPYAAAQQMMDKGDFAGAQQSLREVLKVSPQNIPAHYRLGLAALRMGDPVAAEKEFRTARDAGFDAHIINPLMAQAYMAQGRYRDLLRDFPVQGLAPEQASSLLVLRALAQLSTNDPDAAQVSATEAERLMPGAIEPLLASSRIALARKDPVIAMQKVDRALQINPRSTDALVLRGQLLNLNGDRTRALDSFDSALKLNPNLLTARLERANVLLVSGQDKRAAEDIDIVLKDQPRSAMALYLRGALLTRTEDYAGADAALTKIGDLIGRFPRGYYFQAIDKYNLGQGEQANEAATHFLARNPSDPDAIKLFARIELAARRSTRAIEVLTKAVDGGRGDWEMLELLSRAYVLAGKPTQALDAMQQSASLAPSNADVLTRLAQLRISLGDSARATGELEKALALAPSQPGAGEALVSASIASGDLVKAAGALDALRKVQGDTEPVGNLAAMIQLAQLDPEGARTTLNDVIKRFPDAIQPRINLAKVLVLENKGAEAQTVLAEVLKRQPTNGPALSSMVALLLADGKLPEAQSLVESAHASAPTDIDVTVALINLYIRANNGARAMPLLDSMLKAQPENLELLNARARVQVSLGQGDEARLTYRRILELKPSDVPTRQLLADLLVGSADYDGAKSLLADGLKAVPGNGALLQAYVAVVLKAQGLDPALAIADQLSADPANQPGGRLLRGDVYMSAGKFSEAAAAYSSVMQTAGSSDAVLRLVGALNATGRTEQAAQTMRDWLLTHPTDASVADALASLDIINRRFYDAEEHLKLVLAQRPEDANSLNNLAWVYQQRGDARAQAIAQKAYLISPSPATADTLGWIMTARGDSAAGLTLMRQAAAGLRGDPGVQYHLAMAEKASGLRKEAIATLQPLIGAPGSFDDRAAAERLYRDLTSGN